jgi:hypothetical protein
VRDNHFAVTLGPGEKRHGDESARRGITVTAAITEKIQVARGPWEDVDTGDPFVESLTKIFPSDAELARGAAGFKVGGVRVISILGFEVDSEVAAEKQIRGFSDAFGKVLTELANSSISALEADTDDINFTGLAQIFLENASGTSGTTAAVTLLGTGQYMMAAMAAAIVLSAASLWAAWAPADMIALDIFTLNAQECFDRTDADKPRPPDMARQFRIDDDVLVTVLEEQLEKTRLQPESGGLVAAFQQDRQYRTQDDGDEFSNYLLRFRLTRRVVVSG